MPVLQIQMQMTIFEAALAGDMFQRKIDDIIKELLSVFGIADDIYL